MTKLRPPRPGPDDVIRTRLLQRIEEGVNGKLTLIVTPAGYGKSTLAGHWTRWTERPSCWLTLDESDNDFLVFLANLVGAIQLVDPDICRQTEALLISLNPPPTEQLVYALLNDIAVSNRPFAIVLDDCHVIASPEVKHAVWQLIDRMPPNIAMVITSQAEPAIPTLRLTARGELVELGPADLSFTEEESNAFLTERQECSLDASELHAVWRWSEGWPVALRLVSRHMRGRSPEQIRGLLASLPDNVPALGDYLWDEVLAHRSPELRAFLLQTSILSEVNPELAEAVTQRPDTSEHLAEIGRDNLFLTRLDGPGNWIRYHEVFAEVLRRRLHRETPPADIRELHIRAAAWYEAHGYIDQSATHAVKGENWPQAAKLLTTIGKNYYDQERIGSLRALLRDLPEEPFVHQPLLAYWLAWAELRSGHPLAAERPLRIATQSDQRAYRARRDRIHLKLQVLKYVYTWDVAAGTEAVQQVLERLGADEDAERTRIRVMLALLQETEGKLDEAALTLESVRTLNGRHGNRGLHVLELHVTAGLLLAMGKLKEPAGLFRRVIAIGDEWNDLPVQNAHSQLGEILLDWNRPEAARAHAHTAIDLARRIDTPIQLPQAHALLCRVAWLEENWDLALDAVERSIASSAAAGALGSLRVFEEMQCRLWLATGQLSLAQRWLQHLPHNALDSLRYEHIGTTLTAMRVRIHEGRSDEILHPLELLRAHAIQLGWNREVLILHLLHGMASAGLGNHDASRISIDAALELGSSEEIVARFRMEGARLTPLLHMATSEGRPHRRFAGSLIAVDRVGAASVEREFDPLGSAISPRERDVLRLVAAGMSNRDAGDALFISEESVRSHLRRIYDMLGVTNRTQAIAQARQRDWL